MTTPVQTDPNVAKYREYTAWLRTLPRAWQRGTLRPPGKLCVEATYEIEGHAGLYYQGITGEETDASVIASFPQGNLLKARVFEPLTSGY